MPVSASFWSSGKFVQYGFGGGGFANSAANPCFLFCSLETVHVTFCVSPGRVFVEREGIGAKHKQSPKAVIHVTPVNRAQPCQFLEICE